MRFQIVTLRIPFDPADHNVPSTWNWDHVADHDGIVVLNADPVSEDPDVQPLLQLPDEERIVDRPGDVADTAERIANTPTHRVEFVDGGAIEVLCTAEDPDDGPMLMAAATGRDALTNRDVLVTDLTTGASEAFPATDCEEWFA